MCQLAATNCGAGACAGDMVVPDRRLRRKAYSAYYDSGFSAQQIQREVLPTYSERNVERLLHEFRANFSWEPIGRTNKRKQNGTHKLGAHGLAALGQMLHDDPTLYLYAVFLKASPSFKFPSSSRRSCSATLFLCTAFTKLINFSSSLPRNLGSATQKDRNFAPNESARSLFAAEPFCGGMG